MTENIDVVAAAGAPAPDHVSSSEEVELTIRQAYQAENDFVFTCPTSWTIKQVKEHVRSCLDNHPAVSTQRLIFSGASLNDGQIISNILKERSHVAGEQIFFHLMIAQPYQATNPTNPSVPAGAATEVRRRMQQATYAARAIEQNTNNLYTQNVAAWRQYWDAYNQLTPEAQAEENHRLMAHYHSYATIAGGHMTPVVQTPNMTNEQQQAIWRARVLGQVPPAAPAAPAAAPAANNNQGRVDILEVAYRIFKLVLLFSAILLYSSFERFAVVLCAALFIYFIQLRRNHARNRANQAPAAPAAPPAAFNQEPHVNNNNNGENDGENTAPPGENEAEGAAVVTDTAPAEQQTGMQVFLATCYSFVTSFFASLVPDQPMPMDLN